jgi:hypothetical protein
MINCINVMVTVLWSGSVVEAATTVAGAVATFIAQVREQLN